MVSDQWLLQAKQVGAITTAKGGFHVTTGISGG